MFYLFVILPFLLAPLSALSPPSNPSIIHQPFNATRSAGPLQYTEWPPVPWAYRGANNPIAIVFMAYGREANIDFYRPIISNLDIIVLTMLCLPDDESHAAPYQLSHGIVRVKLVFTRVGVRTASMALAVQQVRDLMETKYGPREISLATIGAAGASGPVASLEVLFGRV